MGVTGFVVTPQQQQETLVLKVEGENLGILIGRRGETMEALSYLTGLVANRLGGDYQKVALDVAGYRSKRENDLVALAKRVGGKVAKTGRSYTMEPMNPYERRIIHSTIRAPARVITAVWSSAAPTPTPQRAMSPAADAAAKSAARAARKTADPATVKTARAVPAAMAAPAADAAATAARAASSPVPNIRSAAVNRRRPRWQASAAKR